MPSLAKPSVVIIDDNEMIREALRIMLRSHEYEVTGEATDGDTGLEVALSKRPDVVCLDVVMPSTSGLDVLKEIKTRLPHTVVLMVTGNRDRETVTSALQGGADGFILKPFNTGTVIDSVKKALAKSRTLS
ncbi:MAG TPA: response regulator transcription factor [Burkholderiaceae bacterium]